MAPSFDRPIVAFDIETIPDPELGRRAWGLEGDDHAVVLEMVRRRLVETSGVSKYPQQPWHRVVCICVTVLDPRTGSVEMRSLGGELDDERSVIAGFFELFEGSSPRLVSWNGGGFDLPVLRYRAMKHGIAAPDFYRADGDRRYSNYQTRYHDLHVDVMDVLSGHGASPRAGLATTCALLDLPGKSFLDGEVYEHFFAGERRRVIEYCKLDTLETMLVFLTWSVHKGALSRGDFAEYLGRVRALVGQQDFAAWAEIATSLERWPSWLLETHGED